MTTLIKKGAQTEIGRKIEELAKKVPAPLSYLIPDPYSDPTGGMGLPFAPVGMTKMTAAQKLLRPYFQHDPRGRIPVKGLEVPEIDRMLKAIQQVPKKLLDFLEDIRYVKEGGSSYTPKGWAGRAFPSTINLEKRLTPGSFTRPLPKAYDLHHELGHVAQDVSLRELGQKGGLNVNFYRKLSGQLEGLADWYGTQLGHKTGTPFIPIDLEAAAYGSEIATGVHKGAEAAVRKMPKTELADPFSFVSAYLDSLLRSTK